MALSEPDNRCRIFGKYAKDAWCIGKNLMQQLQKGTWKGP